MRTGNYGARQRAATRGAQSRTLRIIGGAWRGRRFRFPDVPDIRPTPDRVRETLFNWLGRDVQQSRCLDLFAGSGALGLEALSRGAASVLFVEQVAVAMQDLQERLTEWKASGATVVRSDALQFLRAERDRGDTFDIVFLDPPFTQDLLPAAARLLEERGWLAREALIYVEAPAREALPPLPVGWRQMKAKQAGEVGYHLYARGERGGAAT
jgi:16S rRNA (guanine966-N2)-methyltransferase